MGILMCVSGGGEEMYIVSLSLIGSTKKEFIAVKAAKCHSRYFALLPLMQHQIFCCANQEGRLKIV